MAQGWEACLAAALQRQMNADSSGGGVDGGAGGAGAAVDLNLLSPEATDALPLCAACGRRIVLHAVDALGHTWHPDCFACVHCARCVLARCLSSLSPSFLSPLF